MLGKYHTEKKRYNFIWAGEERANMIRHLVGTGKYILDLGCRDGALAGYFTGENRVVGLDADREALYKCKEALGIDTVWHDVNEALPFEDFSFDVVVAGELLEHVDRPQFLVKEIRRVLKEDGSFVGSTPNALYIKNRLKFLKGDLEEDPFHLHLFSMAALNRLLKAYFSRCSIYPVAGGRNLFAKGVLKKLIRILPSLCAMDFVFYCAGSR